MSRSTSPPRSAAPNWSAGDIAKVVIRNVPGAHENYEGVVYYKQYEGLVTLLKRGDDVGDREGDRWIVEYLTPWRHSNHEDRDPLMKSATIPIEWLVTPDLVIEEEPELLDV